MSTNSELDAQMAGSKFRRSNKSHLVSRQLSFWIIGPAPAPFMSGNALTLNHIAVIVRMTSPSQMGWIAAWRIIA